MNRSMSIEISKDVAAVSSESSVQKNRILADDEEFYWNKYGQPLFNSHSTFKTTSSSKTLTKSLLDENGSSEDVHTSSFNNNGLETVRFDKTDNGKGDDHNGNTIGTILLTSFPPPIDEPAQVDGIQHQETPKKETEKLMISTASSITTDASSSSSSVQKEAQNNEIQTLISDAVKSVYGMAKLNGISKEKFLELVWDAVMKE
ncbi:933_t:CDS:2 [Ambispora gerdemannii]|uniref:933_t:CDS:1 n=1 Tax=Ambispora gerdemannii TaxID=144530 RepID=A0A9N8YZ86_9GLOM|nr:933_t:CDS:2 [Ambispora gerdemannii]